jgi:hypothetical protein
MGLFRWITGGRSDPHTAAAHAAARAETAGAAEQLLDRAAEPNWDGQDDAEFRAGQTRHEQWIEQANRAADQQRGNEDEDGWF